MPTPPEHLPDTLGHGAPAITVLKMTESSMLHKAEPHRYERAQLLFPLEGGLLCASERGVWMVPPNCAIWIPGGFLHSVSTIGAIDCLNVLVDPELTAPLPSECCTLSVPSGLGDLLVEASMPVRKNGASDLPPEQHDAFLAEVARATVENLHLPMPHHARLRQVVATLMANPGARASQAMLADQAGLAEGTLNRVMLRETGLGFSRWRQQMAVTMALRMIAEGVSIQEVATNLGFESPGGFIKMFRRTLGRPPAQYMRALVKRRYEQSSS